MKQALLVGLLLSCLWLAPSCLNATDARSSSPFIAGDAGLCHVTRRPEKSFVPPSPYLTRPPDPVSFWYGSDVLWTQVWAPPPWTPWKPQEVARMYWASSVKSDDEQPGLMVSIKRLDQDEPPLVFTAPDDISYTPERFGMVAAITFPSEGCWQVTGQYRGKTLSYVLQVESASAPRNSGIDSSGASPSLEPSPFGSETHPNQRFSMGPPRSLGRRILTNGNCPNNPGVIHRGPGEISDCDLACGGDLTPCTPKQDKRFAKLDQEQKDRFGEARKLLLGYGVPFDPDILLERHAPRGEILPYFRLLKPVLDQLPEMKQNLRTDSLSGVIMADTLYLPGPVREGPGPVVLLVNHMVSEGCSFVFRGSDSFSYTFGEGRVLGMSLDEALKRNGLSSKQFPGKDHLPPFSVIRDLDLPKVNCNGTLDASPAGLGLDRPPNQ